MIWIYIILALLVVWVVATYNFFASSRARVKAAIQEIGNQLKRQVELIPNLESSTKGYLTHEKDIFEKLTEARKSVTQAVKSGDLSKMAEAGNQMSQVLPRLTIAVESNPELKANTVVIKLMDELRDTSDKVMYARRLLIDLTADYNVKRVSVPSNIVASLFNFEELAGLDTAQSGEHLTVSTSETKAPKVKI